MTGDSGGGSGPIAHRGKPDGDRRTNELCCEAVATRPGHRLSSRIGHLHYRAQQCKMRGIRGVLVYFTVGANTTTDSWKQRILILRWARLSCVTAAHIRSFHESVVVPPCPQLGLRSWDAGASQRVGARSTSPALCTRSFVIPYAAAQCRGRCLLQP